MQDNKQQEPVEETEEVAQTEESAEDLLQKLSECEEKYKRALADYKNLERHVSEQRSVWARQSAKQIVLKLLPVLDTLMLVHKHTGDSGLDLAIKEFVKILTEEGVEQVKTVGEEFDPASMDCVTTQVGKENSVLEEIRAGYVLDGQVIRPAQVVVGKSSQSS